MQIVIDIPEYFYEYCKSQKDATEIQLAVAKGTPLPKGHGQLIDISDKEPCEDCISREALRNLKVSVPIAPIFIGDNYIRYRDVIIYDEIIDLPSVTPTRPTGKWEYVQYDYNPNIGNWHCSECRNIVIECANKNEEGGIPEYKYCPNCGARMEGNSNDK